MKIVVNGPAVMRSSRGVRRYFDNVVQHLEWPDGLSMSNVYEFSPLNRVSELMQTGSRGEIFWSPAQRGPLRAWHHIITIHDCINVEFVYRNDWRLPMYRQLFNTILNNAERIVAISNATRDAVLRNYRVDESKIAVIRSGRHVCSRQRSNVSAAKAGTSRPYVLLVTNSLPHKNNLAACEAFARSCGPSQGVAMRVVGSLPDDAREACIRGSVLLEEHIGVEDAQLSEWYEECLFVLSPSLAEGHNLPIAEALAHGANVLCTDIPVHREFYDGEVKFFEPGSPDALVNALDEAIATEGAWFTLSRDTVHRSFADVANEYAALFASISPIR